MNSNDCNSFSSFSKENRKIEIVKMTFKMFNRNLNKVTPWNLHWWRLIWWINVSTKIFQYKIKLEKYPRENYRANLYQKPSTSSPHKFLHFSTFSNHKLLEAIISEHIEMEVLSSITGIKNNLRGRVFSLKMWQQ